MKFWVETKQDLEDAIEEFGFIPYFENSIEGFSLEEHCSPQTLFGDLDDPETILLIDSWADQEALDVHHASPMMGQLAALRDKYDLHMKVERYVSDEVGAPVGDDKFVRK